MTIPNSTQSKQLIEQAYHALRQNKRAEARYLANSANQLDPGLEEPYLILAALAAPEAAIDLLNQALQINPGSTRARKGMQWAVERLRSAAKPISPEIPIPATPTVVDGPTQPLRLAGSLAQASTPAAVTSQVVQQAERTAPVKPIKTAPPAAPRSRRPGVIWVTTLAVVACLALLAWAGWPFISVVFAHNNSAPHSAGLLVKPTLTSSPTITYTATVTPTNTFTPTPTFTLTPTETSTPTPTNTPTSTNTPLPTDTPEPSSTPRPTKTPLPPPTKAPTKPPQPGSVSVPAEIHGNQNWVDVNLSKQLAYAYQGSTLIRTFVVSTGVAAHPTVTGQFHVYVKYRYALMTGPGYYLPNVPYTMYFYQSYGLHGTYWHHNFGHPMSHGCVNLKTEDAQWLYENFVSIGTLVNIHY